VNEVVDYEAENGIATITLNRPESLNAMNAALLEGAVDALEIAAVDSSIRVVILTGAGRGFFAGGDHSATDTHRSGDTESKIGILKTLQRSSKLLREMPKVTIAAINGPCAGGGLSWAAAADLRYAAASAKFSTAYLNAGLSGDFGGTWTLPRIVGSARARELYLLSEKFTAEDAERYGLVARVLPDEELLPFVRSVAERLLVAAPIALHRIKQNLNDAEEVSFSEALDHEADRHVRTGESADSAEARRALGEMRVKIGDDHVKEVEKLLEAAEEED
jgi:2-(1,2-epoxy-1,2-dihydrophenyl)acetyl-CoA isomerase